ncbi:MAG: TIGR04086 family membrane protein [Alicyclobacillus herbarius]|uniref:TIGR04086 family membrane protein n=1 Tax=Alicyclobacillus herbarius TaxID=122960 RepID=UPI00047C6C80|nr:TIGR04086 family membrane protein [Alicyclobacillus herbarius]MCL6632322.1 TIGR04086 family membrane protein [Alicyclobacillus herbarius]
MGEYRSIRHFPVLYGLTWALVITVTGTVLATLWLRLIYAPEAQRDTAVYAIRCASVVIGAFTGALRQASRKNA